MPDQLSTEKPSSTFISADSKNDFLGARIVTFVIPKGGLGSLSFRERIRVSLSPRSAKAR